MPLLDVTSCEAGAAQEMVIVLPESAYSCQMATDCTAVWFVKFNQGLLEGKLVIWNR